MSNYKGHIYGVIFLDIILITGLYYLLNIYFKINVNKLLINNYLYLTVLVIISIMFSLLPDIDTNSVGGHIYYFLFFVLDIVLIYHKLYKWSAIFGLFVMLPTISKHRGFTHTKIFGLLVCSPFIYIPMIINHNFNLSGLPYFIAAIIGYYSHLLLDGVFFKK